MSNRVDTYDDDDEDFDAVPSAGPSKPPRSGPMDVDDDPEDDEDEDEEDDEDEDDEDEDEDEEMERPKKKKRRSKKRSAISRFIDTEAVVDDEDEDLDDEEEGLGPEDRGFFAGDDAEVDDNIVTAGHHRFARRQQEDEDQDLSKIAQDVTERYRRTARKYTGDTSDLPQQFLMPGVNDPFLWQIRVRPGKERDLVFQLLRKSIDLQFSTRPLEIYSAFERDSLPGMIYVEARSQQHVKQAIDGLVGVFPSRGVTLVPIDEMASLLRIKKIETTITPGSWVRIKRGKYAGDLAQVLDVTDNGEEAGLKFIPRIDLTPREENYLNNDKKRKKVGSSNGGGAPGYRPPQRFFNAEEVSKVYKNKVTMKPGSSRKFVFMGDTYNNGFIEKDVKIIGLITENVNPTLDEIAR
ncbi:transcription elongation factor spt5, partial [Tulasnella sp. 427]